MYVFDSSYSSFFIVLLFTSLTACSIFKFDFFFIRFAVLQKHLSQRVWWRGCQGSIFLDSVFLFFSFCFLIPLLGRFIFMYG